MTDTSRTMAQCLTEERTTRPTYPRLLPLMASPHHDSPNELTSDQVADLTAVLERSRDVGFLGDGAVLGHITHALAFVAATPIPPDRFLDLGSGGGVPGLVLGVAWPAAQGTLVDAQQKRCVILQDAVERLGLTDRVTVRRGRAEELGRDPHLRGQFDVVTARSFGPPAVVAECAAPFLELGGCLVVSEPPDDGDRWPVAPLAQLGLAPEPAASDSTDQPRMKVLRQVEPLNDRYPRRVGIPSKRPLF